MAQSSSSASASASGGTATRKFCVAIVGHGQDRDATLRSYKAVEAKNGKHVRVVTFGGETDPTSIANDLILLVG